MRWISGEFCKGCHSELVLPVRNLFLKIEQQVPRYARNDKYKK